MKDPELLTGWNRIAWLLGQRWPEWEPTVQERADWKRMIGGCPIDWIDEAMLRVKQNYSSRIPQVKWLLGKYSEVKDEHFAKERNNAPTPTQVNEVDVMIEVERDRRDCMNYLKGLDDETVERGRAAVRKQGTGRFLTGFGSEACTSWSWAVRFAVMFYLQDASESEPGGCSDWL
jgi:hypothetical protein|tara:strand:- start:53 stop:577 length:525 start_codon:yes stop_codon:yes gene_type:complete